MVDLLSSFVPFFLLVGCGWGAVRTGLVAPGDIGALNGFVLFFGLPAMLKGWFDRVWAPGVAFDINGGVIRPLLTGVRHVVAVTTMGAPWWFAWFMGHPGRMFLSRGVRAVCGRGCRFTWRAHDRMDSSTPETRAKFLAKVRRTFEAF